MKKKQLNPIKTFIEDWLDNNHKHILEGKKFYTLYDVTKLIALENNLTYKKVNSFLNKNKKLKEKVQEWLTNNFWHVIIALKMSKEISEYKDKFVDMGPWKPPIEFIDNINLFKDKLPEEYQHGFTVNNPRDNMPEVNNPDDEITNFGTEEEYEGIDDEFDK